MKTFDDDKLPRRSLVTGMGVAVAGLMGTACATAQDMTPAVGFQPKRHAQDAWFGELGGNHRVFIDTSSAQGGVDALRYGSNILNAHRDAYNGSDADYAMVVCFRHQSTGFGFGDAIWEKYGEIFVGMMAYTDPQTGQAPKVNNLLQPATGPFAGSTIPGLVDRGVHFAICSMATRGMAGMVAGRTDQDTDDVFDEMVASAIPNAHFVAAGVMGMTRAQEYGYSLLYAG